MNYGQSIYFFVVLSKRCLIYIYIVARFNQCAKFILEKMCTETAVASVRIICETYDFVPDLHSLPLVWF